MDPPDESDGTSSHRGRATIHPPIFFPAPQTPSTNRSSGSSSSGTKRKRVAADDHSDVGTLPSRTRASSTSDFNNNTKVQVRDQYNNQCWHCSASPADVCHVIGSRDNTFQQALADGLIDFQEKQSPQNAIALCGTCHKNYDHVYNPSFFFLPTNLQYFLNYEQQDRKRRRRLGRRTGTIPARMCPTAETYQAHQVHEGIEEAKAGGLYTRIVMHDFLPQYPGRPPFHPGPSEYGATKSWTGSPMASLHRAILMLRRLNLHGIPRDIRDSLRQLQDAYSEELELAGSDTSSQKSVDAGEEEEDVSEEEETERQVDAEREGGAERESAGRDTDQGNEGHEGARESQRQIDLQYAGHSALGDEIKTESIFLRRESFASDVEAMPSPQISTFNSPRSWRWGPTATSEDAAKFFRLVL